MKQSIGFLLFVCVALTPGLQSKVKGAPSESPGTAATSQRIARWHYAGYSQISAGTNGTVFKGIWNLPATAQLRNDSLDKVAAALAACFQPKAQSAPDGCSKIIRPLLNDLCTAESAGEIFEHPRSLLESVLALRLDEERARIWQSNLAKLLDGWELRNGNLTFLATNGWLAIHFVPAGVPASSEPASGKSVLGKLRQGQSPVPAEHEHWLTLEAELARWANWLSLASGKDLPQLDLTVTGKKEYLRSEARLNFREPLSARVEKWQIPTETIRDVLISFTACQGLGPWLKRQPFVQEMGLESIPDQLFFWGLSQTAFQIQAAAPVADGTNTFNRLANTWVPKYNQVLAKYAVGNIRPFPDRPELIWRGLPILVPYLEPVRDHGRDFLHAGIFPVNAPTNPPPTDLFTQLTSKTNVVYYDWEITQARLDQLRPLLQLGAVFLTISPMSTNSSASKWLDAIEPKLGNTITEVTMTSPRQLDLVRTSHLGCNGLELLTLANWMEGTNFPRLNLELGFRPVVKSTAQKAQH